MKVVQANSEEFAKAYDKFFKSLKNSKAQFEAIRFAQAVQKKLLEAKEADEKYKESPEHEEKVKEILLQDLDYPLLDRAYVPDSDEFDIKEIVLLECIFE